MKSALAVAMPRRMVDSVRLFSSDSQSGRSRQKSRPVDVNEGPIPPAILPVSEHDPLKPRTIAYYFTLLVSVVFETALLLINILDKAFFHAPDERKPKEEPKSRD